ncbi:MAG: DUF3108 domain-containing protein [Nitrospiraceae bacterium]|nr:DUF3108 domain-containing protein [Nitrospiraceae bacterium]
MKNLEAKLKKYTAVGMILFVFAASSLICPNSASSFTIPEKFTYDITWTGIKAGTSTLEITETDEHIKIMSTAKSADWVSVFYTVEDRIESTLLKNPHIAFGAQPSHYRVKIREGRHRRDKEFVFRNDISKVTYIDYINNEKIVYDLPSFAFDTLASFYYLRTLRLEVGKSLHVTVFDNKKVWNVEVFVLKKEKIMTPKGMVDTLLVKPSMQSEGIFFKKGDVYIWVTDDEKRIPVKLSAKIAIGSVTATITGGMY